MTTQRLKWLAIILPVAFWLAVLVLRSELFAEPRTTAGDVFALALIGIGAGFFSSWVFRIIDQREAEIRRRSEQLAALRQASLEIGRASCRERGEISVT